jgi:cytochrome c553
MTAFGAQAADAAKAAPKGDAARGQAVAATVCAACHGPDGNSPPAANPKLAGQHAEYLYKQMNNFKAAEGKQPERTSAIMNGMIAAFDEGQMRDMAAYFAAQSQRAKRRRTAKPSSSARSCIAGAIRPRACPPAPPATARPVPACPPSSRASAASSPSTPKPS